jgi:hypothetical protein
MAITFITEPRELTPAFNPLVFIVDSGNKNKLGFRYVVDVYESGTSTKIHESRIAPRFGDGYGFIQLEKIIQSKLSFNLDLTNSTSLATPNAYYKFDLKVGEEFVYSWSYDDFEYRATNKTALNSTTAHGLSVGDQISIKQNDGGVEKPMLEGLFTVIEVSNSTEVIIDISWLAVDSGPTIGGVVKFADNRTVITRDLGMKTKTGFNGVNSFKDFASFNDANIKLNAVNTNGELLTSITGDFYASPESLMFTSFGQYEASNVNNVKFENSNGAVYTKSVVSGTAKMVRQFASGPANLGDLTLLVGSEYYDFWLRDSGGFQLTKKYRVYLDNSCKIEETKILFMDRKGSFVPFSFPLRTYESGEVSRVSFRRQIKENAGTYFNYNTTNQGGGIISAELDKTIKITTNWLNNDMSLLFEEVMTSPVVLIELDGQYFDCEILGTSFEVDKIKNKKMIKKTIQVKLINQNNINI